MNLLKSYNNVLNGSLLLDVTEIIELQKKEDKENTLLNMKKKSQINSTLLYSRNVSDGAGNGGISPSRMAVRAERIRMASISLSESNEKRNRVDDNGDQNVDDVVVEEKSLKQLMTLAISKDLQCELSMFLSEGQPMLYTEFYRLVLVTLDKTLPSSSMAEIISRRRSEEVRELLLECDPLGEGWIFPRVVVEYMQEESSSRNTTPSKKNESVDLEW